MKIHILFSITFLFPKIVPLMTTSKNLVESQRPQMATWRHVACRITKATRAQAHASARAPTPTRKMIECVRRIAFPRQQ